MTAMTKPTDLAAAIDAVEKIYAQVDAALPEQYSNHDAWKARDAAGKAALQRIVDELGGRAGRYGAHRHYLSLMSVSTAKAGGRVEPDLGLAPRRPAEAQNVTGAILAPYR